MGDVEGLQVRLALLARWNALIIATLYLLSVARVVLVQGQRLLAVLASPASAVASVYLVASAATWWWCRRADKPRSTGALLFADAALIVSLSLALALASLFVARPQLLSILLSLILARAALVPSTTGRTAVLSAVVLLPLPLVALVKDMRFEWVARAYTATFIYQYVALAALMITLAAIVSRVIFNLRRDVAEARQLGCYVLDEEIGRGAMGVVYHARHLMLRRPTAVKLLARDAAHGSTLPVRDLARFEREVQLASTLTHPNTVQIYDYGRTPDNLFYYAMEYLEGDDLQRIVALGGALAPARVARVMAQIAGALAEAHQRGLVHRDVKPANIIVGRHGGIDDVAKLLDFGLAQRVDDAGGDDAHGERTAAPAASVVGTPGYMAPEAIASPADVSSAADIYGLGAVAYFLLVGAPPFEADDVAALLAKQRDGEAPALPAALPSALGALVTRCMVRAPGERPTAPELEREARAIAAQLTSDATRADEDAPRRARRPRRRVRRDRPQRGLQTLAINFTHDSGRKRS